ncbi:MAG: serine hydrolase, partial [Acidobacteriota bacterium]
MKLFEEGKIRLNDPVTRYLPAFQDGKSDITVRHLLTHFSGLRPDLDLEPAWSGYETGIQKALIDQPAGPPGVRFVYSDINFILLGEMVRQLSGQTLPDYAREKIFEPLGMRDTMFRPSESLRGRIAPTERLAGASESLRGVVHDETTRYMGGIAGHAGLFTTADDLAKFAEMMINRGERDGVRVLSSATVQKFTTPQSPADQPILRGGGWDMDSAYSSNRGELFPIGSFGHTGFTGTSLWIDPVSKSYVVLLANSVHPQRRPPITSLRGRVATAAAAALGIDLAGVALTGYNETIVGAGLRRAVNRNVQALTGLDVLAAERFAPLKGKRAGLITNHTGLDRDGRRNIDAMIEAGVNLTALYSPEHGIGGREDRQDIGDSRDSKTGIPIYSLYQGENRKPSDQMLRQVDLLVFDIQDVGARFYTYMCTMRNAMIEAARLKLPFWVLDRPNPITGVRVEGPML